MNQKKIEQILRDTAYVRTGGTGEELRTAEYLQARCRELGLDARLEAFTVDMATIRKARLWADGREQL